MLQTGKAVRFITADTIEEKIIKLQAASANIFKLPNDFVLL